MVTGTRPVRDDAILGCLSLEAFDSFPRGCMRRPTVRCSLSALLVLSAACTGLSAGPEVSASMPVPVSRDSAWVRAKRALQAEVFSISAEDSLQGRLSAMRYPSAAAKVGTAAVCRVQVSLTIAGAPESAE